MNMTTLHHAVSKAERLARLTLLSTVLLFAVLAGRGFAHEIQPAVADIEITPPGLEELYRHYSGDPR